MNRKEQHSLRKCEQTYVIAVAIACKLMNVCVAVVFGKFRLWSGLNLEKLVAKFRTQARSQHTTGELRASCKFVIYRSIC